MLSSSMNQKLNAQITREFYSSYLYRQIASCLDSMGLTVLEQLFLVQADEERLHAVKLIDYVQKAGGRLELGAVAAPPTEYASVLAIAEATLAHEREVTGHIHALVAQAEADKDYSTRSYLQWYLDEQVEEEASFADLVQLTRLAGDNLLALEDRVEKLLLSNAAKAPPPAE
jgi:ferritin